MLLSFLLTNPHTRAGISALRFVQPGDDGDVVSRKTVPSGA